METPKHNTGDNRDMVVSYLTIRKAVGILGIALPVVVASGTWIIGNCPILKGSISAYYYTIMGNYFTGTLCAVALFLFTYRGYYYKEQIATNIASLFALGTALFPMNSGGISAVCNIVYKADSSFSNSAHYLSAALLFATLAYISIFIFTKLDPGKSFTKQKGQRNIIYKTCGYIMVIALTLILSLQIATLREATGSYNPVFWLESITLWAFGISWLVKGGTVFSVLKDK